MILTFKELHFNCPLWVIKRPYSHLYSILILWLSWQLFLLFFCALSYSMWSPIFSHHKAEGRWLYHITHWSEQVRMAEGRWLYCITHWSQQVWMHMVGRDRTNLALSSSPEGWRRTLSQQSRNVFIAQQETLSTLQDIFSWISARHLKFTMLRISSISAPLILLLVLCLLLGKWWW